MSIIMSISLSKFTFLCLQRGVLHICFGVFLLEVKFGLFIPLFLLDILRLGLDHLERRESEERRWLRRQRSLLLLLQRLRHLRRGTLGRHKALLGAVAEPVSVLVEAVVVVVVVRDMFTCAEVVGFGVLLLQLMRLVAPVLGVLLVMELLFLRLFLESLPLVRRRRRLPLLPLFPLYHEPLKTIPQPFFFYFGTEQVHLSCHLCTYSTFKALRNPYYACAAKTCSPLAVNS